MGIVCLTICFVIGSLLAVVNGGATIDVYVAVDKKVKDNVYAGPGVNSNDEKTDVEFILTEANKIFERQQGVDIGLRVIKVDILDSYIGNSSSPVDEFKQFLNANNLYSQYNYDVALLFTGFRIRDYFRRHVEKRSTICQKDTVGLVHFDGTATAIIETVHALGFVMGLTQKSCTRGYLLTSEWPSKSGNEYDFAPCSKSVLSTVINQQSCLQKSNPMSHVPDTKPSADMLDVDKMCKRQFGHGAYVSKKQPQHGEKLCEEVICIVYTFPARVLPTPGTVCAIGKTCRFGKCVGA